ncbi:MAG TPA: glycosyltransferase, partial [Kofleriaceae bacterium]|nr:glycosyltransferase [Kofleriaceae bacterium]
MSTLPGQPLLTVVIPVYNEEGILREAVTSLREAIAAHGWDCEILLAENGSRDSTVTIGASLSEEFAEVEMFSCAEPNYGAALREGILRARGTFVICDEIDLCDVDF